MFVKKSTPTSEFMFNYPNTPPVLIATFLKLAWTDSSIQRQWTGILFN